MTHLHTRMKFHYSPVKNFRKDDNKDRTALQAGVSKITTYL